MFAIIYRYTCDAYCDAAPIEISAADNRVAVADVLTRAGWTIVVIPSAVADPSRVMYYCPVHNPNRRGSKS